MSRRIFRITGMLVLLAVLAAACVPGSGIPLANTPTTGSVEVTPVQTETEVVSTVPAETETVGPAETETAAPADTETPAPMDGPQGALPDAAAAAVDLIANALGINPASVQIPTIEEQEWPDACLGLPYDEESCAQVVTPGFRIELEAGGETFELRTDRSGANIRIAQGGSSLQALLVQAQLLVRQQVEGLQDLQVVRIERAVFPDSCLGIARPEASCLAEEVPGYILTLAAGETEYEVRAAADGSKVALVPAGQEAGLASGEGAVPVMTADFEELARNAILTYEREGGIAGLCDRLAVLPNGQVYVASCESAAIDVLTLNDEEMSFIQALLTQVGSFDLEEEGQIAADELTTRLSGVGLGNVQVTAEQIEALQALLDVFLTLAP